MRQPIRGFTVGSAGQSQILEWGTLRIRARYLLSFARSHWNAKSGCARRSTPGFLFWEAF